MKGRRATNKEEYQETNMSTMSRLQIATLALLLICHTAIALLPLFRIDAALPKDNDHGSSESLRTLNALVEEDAKSYVLKEKSSQFLSPW